eukprot:snap_masked-scaffold_21-processed-gene-5.54-mRNA-1 protein AED:1.00 eAED:1.00 QI:0/-1/0/0/-1/1/1/0/524
MLWPVGEIDAVFSNIQTTSNQDKNLSIHMLVSPDLDAAVAAKLLTALFQLNSLSYSLSATNPENFDEDLTKAVKSNVLSDGSIQSIILLNCGSSYDLSLYNVADDVIRYFYVIDCNALNPNEENQKQEQTNIILLDTLNILKKAEKSMSSCTETVLHLLRERNVLDERTLYLGSVVYGYQKEFGRINGDEYVSMFQELCSWATTLGSDDLKLSREPKLFMHRKSSLFEGFMNSLHAVKSFKFPSWEYLRKGENLNLENKGNAKLQGVRNLSFMFSLMGISLKIAKENWLFVPFKAKQNFALYLKKKDFVDQFHLNNFHEHCFLYYNVSSLDYFTKIKNDVSLSLENGLESLNKDIGSSLDFISSIILRKLQLIIVLQIVEKRRYKSAGDFRWVVINIEDVTNIYNSLLGNSDAAMEDGENKVLEMFSHISSLFFIGSAINKLKDFKSIDQKPFLIGLVDGENTTVVPVSDHEECAKIQDAFEKSAETLELWSEVLSFEYGGLKIKHAVFDRWLVEVHETLVDES